MAKLYFYYSAMNAGKTTTLLQSNYNYKERGMETLVFIPAIDDRHSQGVIASRIGLEAHAIAFAPDFSFYPFVEEAQKEENKLACILIDEAQFLTKQQVKDLAQVADQLKIPVLCYGLRTDFQGEPFPGSLYLLSWAQEMIEIKTICSCGRKATMNLRVDEKGHAVKQGAQIEIGGNDRYVAMCSRHFWQALKDEDGWQDMA